ncbi:MAG: acyloxyacyl hydrolase [Bacteroidota bacterium]
MIYLKQPIFYLLTFLLCWSIHHPCAGQLFTIKYQPGKVLQTNPDVINLDIGESRLERFTSYSMQVHRQTYGEKEWEQRYNYPTYGLGINVTNFYMRDKLGVPISLYGHFSSCFVRGRRIEFAYEFNVGLAFNWKTFEAGKNEYYAAPGSRVSVYVSPGLGLRYRINDYFKIATMLSIAHFSNSATQLPNRGINMFAPSIQLTFSNHKEKQEFIRTEWSTFQAKNELIVNTFIGNKHRPYKEEEGKNKYYYTQNYFPQFGVQLTFNRHFSYTSKVGFGVDFLLDNAILTKYSVEEASDVDGNKTPFSDRIAISIFPSYEIQVNKTSMFVQPGFYIVRKNTSYDNPGYYQRIGMRHRLTDRLLIGANVRAYRFHVADFVEWTVGYKIF